MNLNHMYFQNSFHLDVFQIIVKKLRFEFIISDNRTIYRYLSETAQCGSSLSTLYFRQPLRAFHASSMGMTYSSLRKIL